MTNGIVVDTCSLISYVDATQPHHETARQYIQHALSSGIDLYLPTPVIAEFSRRQNIADLGLGNFIPVPFNVPDAVLAGKLAEQVRREAKDHRALVMVDVMILAQAQRLGLRGILTDDKDTLGKFAEHLFALSLCDVKCILTTNGFDPALLENPDAPGLALRIVQDDKK